MKWLCAVVAALVAQACVADTLAERVWIHGSHDCSLKPEEPLEVFQFDADSWILRQSKCVNFEAPFIYVLFGQHTVFVLDTGATEDPEEVALYDAVRKLAAKRRQPEIRMLVAHSHSHGDHRSADAQFRGKPGVTLIEANAEAVRGYYKFAKWPEGLATIDLGGRVLEVVPSPGHQDEGIVVYDARNGWLLTGDNLYPGRLYVRNWDEFRASIARLAEFAKKRRITAVLGAHIEMSRSGTLFEAGSTYQPDEASLVLTVEDLSRLDQVLRAASDGPRQIPAGKFVVEPIGAFWRVMGDVIGWFSGD